MVPFAKVLHYLESHDWILFRINPPYRVFYQHGDPQSGLPILVEVVDGSVDDEVWERIRGIVEGEPEDDDGEE